MSTTKWKKKRKRSRRMMNRVQPYSGKNLRLVKFSAWNIQNIFNGITITQRSGDYRISSFNFAIRQIVKKNVHSNIKDVQGWCSLIFFFLFYSHWSAKKWNYRKQNGKVTRRTIFSSNRICVYRLLLDCHMLCRWRDRYFFSHWFYKLAWYTRMIITSNTLQFA